MDVVFLIIVGVFVIGFVVWASFLGNEAEMERIRTHVHQKGGTVVDVSYLWFEGDRDTRSYDVSYRGPNGRLYTNRCKIRSGWTRDDALYWRENIPNFRVTKQTQTQPTPAMKEITTIATDPSLLDTLAEQRELIDNLTMENANLRAEIEELKISADRR